MAPRKATNTNTPAPTKAQLAAQVTQLRHAGNSWATIATQLGGMAPRTARSLYQLANGAHSHHGTLPGKGGRYPQGYVAPTQAATKAPGQGVWVARTQPNGAAGTLAAAVAPAAPAKAPAKRATKAPAKAKATPKGGK